MIEAFWNAERNRTVAPSMAVNIGEDGEIVCYLYIITHTDVIHLRGLLDDHYVELIEPTEKTEEGNNLWWVVVTEKGKQFINDYFSGAHIE